MFFIVKNHWEPYFTDNLHIILCNSDLGMTAMVRSSSNCKLQTHPLIGKSSPSPHNKRANVRQ
jgi:hypothetical protein